MNWLQFESRAYWLVFVVVFLLVAIWESLRPRLELSTRVERRWTRHGAMLIISTAVSIVLLRLSPVAVAVALAGSRFGLLNRIALPFAIKCTVAVVALDFSRYAAHWSLHATRLWHIHQVHHSDPDFDVSTGARAHPLEVVWVQAVTMGVVTVLAAPPAAVLIIEVAALVQSFFSHANVVMPAWLERSLRCILVTPDMHRIHHSAEITEQFKNLSEILSIWDRLFGTYLAEPAAGQEAMVVGMPGFRGDPALRVGAMLLQPFRRLDAPAKASLENARLR